MRAVELIERMGSVVGGVYAAEQVYHYFSRLDVPKRGWGFRPFQLQLAVIPCCVSIVHWNEEDLPGVIEKLDAVDGTASIQGDLHRIGFKKRKGELGSGLVRCSRHNWFMLPKAIVSFGDLDHASPPLSMAAAVTFHEEFDVVNPAGSYPALRDATSHP